MKSLLDKSADFFLSRISHGVSISIMYFYGISFIFGRYESRWNKYESRMKISMHFKVCDPFPKRYFFYDANFGFGSFYAILNTKYVMRIVHFTTGYLQ